MHAGTLLCLLVLYTHHPALSYRHGVRSRTDTGSRTQDVHKTKGLSGSKRENQGPCYEWRPTSLTVHPGNDSSLIVRWHPAFTASGFVLILYTPSQPKHYYRKLYPSFESRFPVTNHTFRNVTPGRYKVRMKPTGCTDCPGVKLEGCHPNPTESQEVALPTRTDKLSVMLEERQEGAQRLLKTGPDAVSRPSRLPAPDPPLLAILVSVPLLLLFLVIALLVLLIRHSRQKTRDGYFTAQQHSCMEHGPGPEKGCGRIILLHSEEHAFHVAAVRSLAVLLRALLNIDVLTRGLDSVKDTGEDSGWTDVGNTVVLVVLSRGLLQLGRTHQEGVSRESRESRDVNSLVGHFVHWYIKKHHLQSSQVVPVSLGYDHDYTCVSMLQKSFTFLFPEKSIDLTTVQSGVRICRFSELWKSIHVNKPISGLENLEETRVFLRNVDHMDQHFEVCGQWWWGRGEELTDASGPYTKEEADSKLDTATVGTDFTESSHVAVQRLASDTVAVLCDNPECVRAQCGLEGNLYDASCVTLDTLHREWEVDVPGSETEFLLPPGHSSNSELAVSAHNSDSVPVNEAESLLPPGHLSNSELAVSAHNSDSVPVNEAEGLISPGNTRNSELAIATQDYDSVPVYEVEGLLPPGVTSNSELAISAQDSVFVYNETGNLVTHCFDSGYHTLNSTLPGRDC